MYWTIFFKDCLSLCDFSIGLTMNLRKLAWVIINLCENIDLVMIICKNDVLANLFDEKYLKYLSVFILEGAFWENEKKKYSRENKLQQLDNEASRESTFVT